MGGRCESCAHYIIPTDQWPPFPFCSCPKFLIDYARQHTLPRDGVIISSDEDWFCGVGPEFGCIHWTAKKGK
jgi:hypothetical protein